MESNELFLPRHPNARMQVLKARQIVKDNNEFIEQLKIDGQVVLDTDEDGVFFDDSMDTDQFDLKNIKTTDGFTDFFREIFNV